MWGRVINQVNKGTDCSRKISGVGSSREGAKANAAKRDRESDLCNGIRVRVIRVNANQGTKAGQDLLIEIMKGVINERGIGGPRNIVHARDGAASKKKKSYLTMFLHSFR